MRTLGLSGLGFIGRQHLEAALHIPDLHVVAYDPVPELRRHAVDSAPDRVVAVDRFDDLVAAAPHAAVVATPDEHHLNQLLQTVEAGIPTLVEKPLSTSVAAADAALPRLTASATPILVGYVLRYRPVLQRVRELLGDGVIGTPTGFQVMLGAYETLTRATNRFDTAAPDRLYRDYSHEWDYLRWVFGPIRSVFAYSRTERIVERVQEPNVVDGLLRTDGVVGAFHIDYLEDPSSRTLSVIGAAGRIVADLSAAGTVALLSRDTDTIEHHPLASAAALAAQMHHLLDVADGRAEPLVGLVDGIAAIAVADAAIASAATGRWVELPEDSARSA
ncbi:Gfo/Idh/MocA family oxidoreductase [Humibacter ginsengiterrae]